MRKRNLLLVAVIVASVFISAIAPASAETTGGVGIMVNNRTVLSSTATVYHNGTILVPAKEFVESLGGTFSYDSTSTLGTIRQGENELVFQLDDSVVKYNGKYIQASAPMKIVNYRFMIPAEFVAVKLGAEAYLKTSKNILMVFQPVDGKIVYQVMSGDTLWIISQLFGTSISTLKQLNGLTTDMLNVNQKLVIKNSTPFSIVIPAYIKSNATLFSGAGFGFSVVGYLQTSTNISVVGKNGDWYKVITPKGNGYIYYTVTGFNQDLSPSAQKSSFFDKEIPVDTSKDTITYISYTVQKGDYIWALAQKYGIPDYELTAANNMTAATVLYPGQTIRIPVHNIPVKDKLSSESGEILDWFKEAQYLFSICKTGKLTDVKTGKSFNIKRTIGANHADCEVLTAADAAVMKEIFGGSWTWKRRPFILEVDGRRYAVSVAGMPHAGVDGVPYLQNVENRSDNWGYGPNYDSISGNGMDGHFDVFFLNSLRHKDSKIDSQHQYNVLVAGGLR